MMRLYRFIFLLIASLFGSNLIASMQFKDLQAFDLNEQQIDERLIDQSNTNPLRSVYAGYQPTSYKDIVKWVDLPSGQYVLGMGKDPSSGQLKPFAVYDKTFPRPLYLKFWRNGILAAIGVNDLNLAKLVQIIEDRVKKYKNTEEASMLSLIFQKKPDGTYPKETDDVPWEVYAPAKIIDLQAPYSSLGAAYAWGISTQILKQLTNLIPMFGVSNLAYALLERFFNLIEVLYLTRHNMALQMVLEAIEGDINSPFYGYLNKDELEDAVVYLRRSSTILSQAVGNTFRNKYKLAHNYLKTLDKRRQDALKYLNKKGYTVYPFDKSFYSLAIKRDASKEKIKKLKIFSLLKRKRFRKNPHTVVNFLHPRGERVRRNVAEFGLFASSFLFPLPMVASLLRLIYREVLIREYHRRQMAEAGFRAHMNHHQNDLKDALLQEGFTLEKAEKLTLRAYDIIYKKEMNPLDIRKEDEDEYLQKVSAWIAARNSNSLSRKGL